MNENEYYVAPPEPPQRKPRLMPLVAICLISALIGGVSSVSLVQYISPETLRTVGSTGSIQSTNNANTVSLLANSLPTESNSPVVQVAKNVGPAVVGISNYQPFSNIHSYGYGFSFGSQENTRSSELVEAGTGSGFIIDAKQGYIVTNYHVIEGAQKITVSLSDGRNLEAKLVGSDAKTDLAVLKLSDTSNLTEVTLGESSKIEVGEYVVAIGNPGGNEFARSVTAGVISATNRTLAMSGESTLYNMLQTDAAINPGNSGGPLVNYNGQVIGINSAKYAESGFEGMGFAIPITEATTIIEQLIGTGTAKHPALYVSVSDQYLAYAEEEKLPLGAYIYQVDPNGPAGKAGILEKDVITHIDGVKVENSTELIGEIYKHNVGDQVTLTFVRNGEVKEVKVTLGEMAAQ
ncbi:trypsin-like serine protease with C-terminal PDZ domain [Desulfitobacterium dichloroeliminans LMG P-21439]|uniref:Trypsin-like serine protease with C-terminal PDZ domain n=1 Tax=Desulfitobacterium dichloroeliminans (strain LMG P-21439 / DCA1) TaxID=871963 RepID=L0F6T4_DESDL|nr:trypsin-like peptidase domain-containing protein [Desulfitobacterium dichloroeliminans]AGA68371.1 trypsin-like serine protease with C-terminal PDZ domain [Desulfitobacterium dichloroeliminans LMG P-21439]